MKFCCFHSERRIFQGFDQGSLIKIVLEFYGINKVDEGFD